MRPARIAVLAALLALAAAPAGASAAGTTSVDFESLAPGTTVTDQYAAQGVRFGIPSDFGLPAGNCGEPVVRAPGVTNRSAEISCQKGEFQGISISGAMEFDSERRAVSFKLKAVGVDQTVTVVASAIGGTTLQTQTVSLPAGQVVNVAFNRPTPDIVAVRLYGGAEASGFDDHVYLDDVSSPIEDPASIQPKFSVTLLQPRVDVVEGASVTVPVRISRYNGSVGPVQVNVDSLPSGVTGVQPTPNPVTGRDPTQLKISVGSPLTGDRQLTVSAVKPAGAPSTVGIPVGASVVQTVHAISALSFTDRAAGEIVFTPGCAFSPTESVNVRGGYRGHVTMTVAVVSGATAPTAISGLTASADGAVDFPYPMPFQGPGSGVVRITLTPDHATPVTRDVPVRIAQPLSDVFPTTVRPPQALQDGTLVTLRGEGFCGSPNTRVRFGNDEAYAKILSRNVQGTEITVRVPRLATSGVLQLVPDITNPKANVIEGPMMTVNTYRNTAGFPFHNYTPHLTVDQMSATFGRAATHITADACGALTLGVASCRVITPIPDPWAMIVLAIANATMGKEDGGGACFGFSRTSEQLRMGRFTYAGLGNDLATNAFSIPGSNGPNGSVQEVINANQLSQLSNEYAGYYLTHAVGGQFTATPQGLRKDLEARLKSNDYPMLSLRTGGTIDELHVVVAYDIEDDPAVPGGYYIDVYDSNQPYIVPGYVEGDKTYNRNETTEADLHKQRTEDSRIRVRPDGYWILPSSDMSASSLGNIVVGGIDDPPSHPTLITGKGLLKGGIVAMFGSAAGDVVGRLAAAGQPGPPSTTAQISVGDRHLYSAPGVLEKDKSKALNATPWLPATGAASGVEGFLLGGGANATYTVDLAGGRSGSQTRTVLGDGVASQVTAPSRPGVTDHLSLTPGDAEVGFSSGKGSVAVSLETMARGAGDVTHGAAVTVTSGAGGHDTIGFDAGHNVVKLEHDGKPATVSLTLSSFGKTLPQSGRVSVRVGRGTTTIRPGSWTGLRNGTATVRSGGKTKKVRLRARSARGAKLSSLKVTRRGSARTASVKVKVPSSAAAGTANVTFAVTRGKKAVATKTLEAGAAGTRTLSWRLPSKVRRGDRVVAVATTVVQRGTQFDSAVSKKTARVKR